MKRIWILLTVIALGVVIATPATADKPDCSVDPTHASCKPSDEDPPDDGPIGMTCVEADAALRNISHADPVWMPSGQPTQQPGDDRFQVALNNKESACVDVSVAAVDQCENEYGYVGGCGPWTITVETLGSADAVSLAVGDSVNPGDTCWGGCHGDVEATVTTADCDGGENGEPCKVLTPLLPASGLDSCGLWIGDNGFADGDPQMAFTASYSGVKKLAEPVLLEVTLP
jgi:hypothetical protein